MDKIKLLEQLKNHTVNRNYENIKMILQNQESPKDKGELLEIYIKELYEGNGWICNHVGGKDDKGADILLSHPNNPQKIEHIIQVKNHNRPLTFKDAKSELVQFEEITSKVYSCNDYKLISINGYTSSITDKSKMVDLQRFNISLLDFDYIKDLINTYKIEKKEIKPTLVLYSHNELSYKNILHTWENSTKAAVIQATGTGKSKIILKIFADKFYNKNKLLIAPSNWILNQFKEDDDNWALNNTTYLTYSMLMRLSEEEMKKIDPDIIVLDEYHRAGAEEWGKGVDRLLEIYKEIKLLGTTATPIRTDGKNMSYEIFDGHIASNLSIYDAIINNKLPMPKYVSAVYDLSVEIKKMQEKIIASKDTLEKKNILMEKLLNANIDWENSGGISEILKKHISGSSGKGIIFCEDSNHLYEMEEVVRKWFKKANFKIKTNTILSKDIYHREEFEEFRGANCNGRICLLFSVDMINEGIHIPDVDFVIFLRKTNSEIVYLQQLGRVLQSDKKNHPLVFDFVCNFINVKNGSFLDGFDKCIRYNNNIRKRLGLKNIEFSLEKIKTYVYDESQDIQNVFKDIENALIYTWNQQYSKLKQFFELNGHSDLPSKYNEDKSLGYWVGSQRKAYNEQKLSNKQIKLLEEIHFKWNPKMNEWMQSYNKLISYFEKYGHSDVSNKYKEHKSLASWVYGQRRAYRESRLDKDQIDLLEKLNFKWNYVEGVWIEKYNKLIEYYKEHGNSDVPSNYTKDNELKNWVQGQRKAYRNNRLEEDKIKLLKELDFKFSPFDDLWMTNYNILKEIYEKNGHCNITDKSNENKTIAAWKRSQRKAYRNNELDNEKVKFLSAINFKWNPLEEEWMTGYKKLEAYYEKNGHSNVLPKDTKDVSVCAFVRNQRNAYKKNRLNDEKIELLKELDFIFDPIEELWMEKYNNLKEYVKENNNCNVPLRYEKDKSLGAWVSRQRTLFKKNKLSEVRISMLENLGFVWDIDAEEWNEKYNRLKLYYEKYGDSNIPAEYNDDQELAYFVRNQRTAYKKRKLSENQIQLLKKIDFVWDINKHIWMKMYDDLKQYYLYNGNSDVPNRYKENVVLGTWVYNQRKKYKNGKLEDYQKILLDSVEFRYEVKTKV